MSIQPTEDLLRPRAERYAQAIASASAAEERIKSLTDTLAEHEWRRTQAEIQLEAVQCDEQFGKLWTAADAEPPPQIEALLCLATGGAWVRATRFDGSADPHYWVRADASQSGQTRHEWPIGDAGPFITLRESWHLRQVMRDARRRDETEDRLRALLRDKPAYRKDGEWTLPEIADAAERVISDMLHRLGEARAKVAEYDSQIHRLSARVSELETKLATVEGGDAA